MSLLLAAYRIAGLTLLAALVIVVIVQLTTGRITTRGLITDKNLDASDSISPARAQLLFSTLTVAALYVYRVVTSGSGVSLPDVPGSVLSFVAASQVTYMVGKAITVLSGRSKLPR
jgi:hypothetical protein